MPTNDGFEPGSYFMPPVQKVVARWERVLHVSPHFPRSSRFRGLATKGYRGLSVTINGVLYAGGRWHGPLSPTAIAEITAAGYATRIVVADGWNDLPAYLPEDE